LVRHPRIVTEVDFLLFYFAGYLVGKLDICLQWRLEGKVVFLSFTHTGFRLAELVLLEAQFELLPGVVFDWIKLSENLTKTSLDKFLPRLFLVNDEVWYW